MNYLHSQLFLQLGFKLDSGRDSASKLLCGDLTVELQTEPAKKKKKEKKKGDVQGSGCNGRTSCGFSFAGRGRKGGQGSSPKKVLYMQLKH